jgi:hypothetical protein
MGESNGNSVDAKFAKEIRKVSQTTLKQRGWGVFALRVQKYKEKPMSEPTKCAHENCTCVCSDGKKFCSEICEDSAGTQTLSCDCPHTGCGGKL